MPGHRIAKETFKDQQLYKKYSCLSCGSLLRDAVQSALCGHWFCESCISLLLNTRDPKCPSCSENLISDEDTDCTQRYFPDKFVRRDINALEMVCIYGCGWEGTFSKLEGHLVNCEHSVCETCLERLTTVPNDHKCTLRDEDGIFSCPLVKVGCTAGNFENKGRLELHMRDSDILHSELLATSITDIKGSVDDIKGSVDDMSLFAYPKVEADEECPDAGYSSIDSIERGQMPYRAPTQEVDNKARIQGVLGITGMQADIEAVRTELNIKEEELTSLRAQITKLERNQRSKNADFEDRDFRLSLIENSNRDGTMVWKIPQFSQRNTDAQSGKCPSICSLPFYSGHHGYKMCLRLYILGDGIGKGNYMSLFFVLMKGEFDNILPWPFIHKVTFKLLNQGNGRDTVDTFQPDPMSTSFSKPNSDMNIASGCPRFVSHEDLKSGGFKVDDTIFIKCIVDSTI